MDSYSKKSIPKIAMTCLDSGYVAILSQKQTVDNLTVWETKYGTLQSLVHLYDGSIQEVPDLTSVRSFSLENAPSSSYGDALAVSVFLKGANSTKHSLCKLQIVTYDTPKKITLLSALGRLAKENVFNPSNFQGQMSSIIPVAPPTLTEKHKPLNAWKNKVCEWETSDSDYLLKLLDTAQTPNTESFQSLFMAWVKTKNSLLRGWATSGVTLPKGTRTVNVKSKTKISQLPNPQFSQPTISLLLERCFQDTSAFWPRDVVVYLLKSGSVGASFSNDGEKLMDKLVSVCDLELIEIAFSCVGDLDEEDYVSVIKMICDDQYNDLFMKWWKKKKPTEAMDVDEVVAGIQLNRGQQEFLSICFSAPRVDSTISKHLKTLSSSQLSVLFEWIRQILAPSFDTNLSTAATGHYCAWWMWGASEGPEKSSQDKEYRKWLTVCLF